MEAAEAAGRAGVPVARIRVSGDELPEVGGAFMVMEHVDGESIARRIFRDGEYRDVRDRLGSQCGGVLAAIHAVPLATVGGLEQRDVVADTRRHYEDLDSPSTAFEIGFQWLMEHPRPEHDPALVHGDFRMGNLIVTKRELAAVLDWELAHIGDPLEDLGWFFVRAWRFGGLAPGGGVASHDEVLDGYAEVAAWRPDLADVAWWQMVGTLRWGIGCMGEADRFSNGANATIETAGIARRVPENELAVLELVEAEGW